MNELIQLKEFTKKSEIIINRDDYQVVHLNMKMNEEIPDHSHLADAIITVLKGELLIDFVGGEGVPVKHDEVYCFDASDVHNVKALTDVEAVLTIIKHK